VLVAMLLLVGGVVAVNAKTNKPTLSMAKPVIYLYPKITTDVTVQIDKVNLEVDVPKYKNAWVVQAQPNGKLKDLQPQFTDCMSLDNTSFGLEYTRNACKKNEYPYIYWAGKSRVDYEGINEGFIVERANLVSFMNSKLNEIGLSDKEKFDMLEYWLPMIQKKNKPFYKVSFLLNAEMDKMAPLTISPKPDTILRVFLDYEGLDSKPRKELLPQKFKKLERKGFTVIEWGGAKR
jgi:hypothetical protein